MNPKIRRRMAAAAAAILMLLGTGGVFTAGAATKSELEQKLAELQQKEKQLKSELSKASSELSASQQRKNLIDSQIDNAVAQISLLDEQLAAISQKASEADQQISAAEEAIAAKEASILDTKEKLSQRLRAVMKSGNVTTLQMLMNTKSYTDYLIKAKAVRCIAEKDQSTIDALEAALLEIEQQKQTLEAARAELEAQKKSLEETKATSTAKKKELEQLYSAAASEVKNLQSTVNDYNKQIEKNQAEMEKTDADIAKFIQNSQSSGSFNGKMMFWPVPTVRNYSSTFGMRWGKLHKGLDIANGSIPIYGENIVAAADGTVIYANYTNKWGGGYGYYCIVDHGKDASGKTISTLYAHSSVMLARVGQKVIGGQTVLAKAGNTGNVTGPHLHFEVRENGTPVDPLDGYVHPKVN